MILIITVVLIPAYVYMKEAYSSQNEYLTYDECSPSYSAKNYYKLLIHIEQVQYFYALISYYYQPKHLTTLHDIRTWADKLRSDQIQK